MAVWSAVELARAGYKGSEIAALRNQGKVVDYAHGPKWFSEQGLSGGYGGLNDYSKLSGSGSSVSSVSRSASGSALSDYLSQLQSITASNNAWSASQAQKQMDFQAEQGVLARQYNHDEAELNRLWQERMSNTAHQREIKDLQAAGLNPVLSAMGGSGAPVTSGATAAGYSPPSGAKGDTDTSLAPALVSLLGYAMQTQASLSNAALSASTQERIAQLGFDSDVFKALTSAASAREVANIQGYNSRVVASINANASVSSARIHASATTAAAQIAGQYSLSVAQTNQLTNIITHAMDNVSKESIATSDRESREKINRINNKLQKDLQNSGFEFQLGFAEDQYTRDWKLHMWDNAADLLGDVIRGGFQLGSAGLISGAFGGKSSKSVLGFLGHK